MSFLDDVTEPESANTARDPLVAFDGFVSAVRARLEAGRATYGDRSFSKPPAALIGELQQETLDLAGWGFVLWCRLEEMRSATCTTHAAACVMQAAEDVGPDHIPAVRLVGAEREHALATLDEAGPT